MLDVRTLRIVGGVDGLWCVHLYDRIQEKRSDYGQKTAFRYFKTRHDKVSLCKQKGGNEGLEADISPLPNVPYHGVGILLVLLCQLLLLPTLLLLFRLLFR